MSFDISSEQEQFQESVRGFLAGELPLSAIRKSLDEGKPVHLPSLIKPLDLFSYFSSPDSGKQSFRELALLAFEAGRALVPGNLATELLVGPYLFYQLLTEKERAQINKELSSDFLAGLRDGTGTVTVIEPALLQNFKIAKNNKVSFDSRFVAYAGVSSHALVIALEKKSAKLFLSLEPLSNSSWSIGDQDCLDQTIKRGNVTCKAATVIELSAEFASHLLSLIRVLRASELAGICDVVVEMTRQFVISREQFGVPVGAFQAVQHKLVDMSAQSNAAQALVHFASWAAVESPDQLPFSADTAEVNALEIAPFVVEQAIQLHGGIGFTWEHDLHLYLRRVKTLAALYGAHGEDRISEFLARAAAS